MRQTKRQLQKESTRQKILTTAFRVYSENGFQTSTSVVAKFAGVAHGSIFLHFPTLEDLLSALTGEFKDSLCERFSEISDNNGTIAELLKAYIDVIAEKEDFYTRLVNEMVLLPGSVKADFADIQSCFASHFHEALNREIEAGTLKKLPPNILFQTWIGLVHYYLQNEKLNVQGSVLKRYKNQIIFTYCEMLRRQY